MEVAAVQQRLTELQLAISVCDEDIRKSEHAMETGRNRLQSHMESIEAKHMNALKEKEQYHADEFDADNALTEVFQQRAHATCIQSVLNQQDSVLQPEFITQREQLLEAAEKELELRKWALDSQHKKEMKDLEAQEEAAFEKRVKRAMHAHEENLRNLH